MPPPYRDPHEPLADPATLPRGVVPPPQDILDVLARDRVRLAPNWSPEYEFLVLNDMTLAWYFEHHIVIYRPTPHGPEVLAVDDEIEEYLKNNTPELPPGVVITQP
jgi:hypothetical protein